MAEIEISLSLAKKNLQKNACIREIIFSYGKMDIV